MKKFASAALAALLLCAALVAPAKATDRITWYYGMNPPSSWLNYMQRYERLGLGQFIFDVTGVKNWFNNLTIAAATGLNVTVGPASSNTVGSLYQYLPEETSTYGGPGVTALPTDPDQVELQGLMYATGSAFGPLTAGASAGQSVDNLIECKVATVDQTPLSETFVTALGVPSSSVVNRDRADTISCKGKAGTSATTGSQTVPATDSGYVALGYVAIANGVSTITSGMITMLTPQQTVMDIPFAGLSGSGWVANGAAGLYNLCTASNAVGDCLTANASNQQELDLYSGFASGADVAFYHNSGSTANLDATITNAGQYIGAAGANPTIYNASGSPLGSYAYPTHTTEFSITTGASTGTCGPFTSSYCGSASLTGGSQFSNPASMTCGTSWSQSGVPSAGYIGTSQLLIIGGGAYAQLAWSSSGTVSTIYFGSAASAMASNTVTFQCTGY